jgi:hypothetical protein
MGEQQKQENNHQDMVLLYASLLKKPYNFTKRGLQIRALTISLRLDF